MKLIMNENKRIDSIAIGGWFVQGAFNDPYGEEGSHHFLEHMIFNTNEIQTWCSKLRKKGINLNAFTSHEIMCFYVICLKDDFLDAFEFIHSILTGDQSWDGDIGFENERKIIYKEIEYHSNFVEKMKNNMLKQMFPDNIPNFSIMGSKESVNRISKDELLKLYNKSKLFSFMTIAGGDPCLREMVSLSDYKGECHFKFQEVEPMGNLEYIEEGISDYEFCYFCLSKFFPKVYRNEAIIYAEYVKEFLFEQLREGNGFTYRINTANVNLYNGLISFWIFKINKNDLEAVKKIVEEICQKMVGEEIKKFESFVRVKTILRSDNVSSEMLSLGYKNTILSNEQEGICDWAAFIKYINCERRDFYQRIEGFGCKSQNVCYSNGVGDK